jgi:hypothetical protein
LAALHWLKKHSIEHQDIVIQESNLDWTKDKEGQKQDLPPCDIELDAESTDVKPSVQDRGPAPSQAVDVLDRQEEGEEEETAFGMLPGMSPHLPKEKDSPITKSLQEETQQSKTNNSGEATINFPHMDPNLVSEHDVNSGLFAKAFPWLFPGAEETAINSETQNSLVVTGQRTQCCMKMAVLPRTRCLGFMF